jgi:hypothetical protein
MYLTFLLAFAIGIGGGVYLVVNDHPWFALLVFIITASLSVKSS